MWLGPAMTPLVAALGGAPEHHCACGMKRGTCGCPECAALERARARENRDARLPTVRTTCDDTDVSPSAAAIPPCVAASPVGLVAASSVRVDVSITALRPIDANLIEPPTPPPRICNA
jgi:hypothetical protein